MLKTEFFELVVLSLGGLQFRLQGIDPAGGLVEESKDTLSRARSGLLRSIIWIAMSYFA